MDSEIVIENSVESIKYTQTLAIKLLKPWSRTSLTALRLRSTVCSLIIHELDLVIVSS